MKKLTRVILLVALTVTTLLGIPSLAQANTLDGSFVNISSPVSLRRASYASNAHYYTFYGTAGQTVTIDMTATGCDGYLYLADSMGNVVTSDDNSGEGYNPKIEKVLPITGTYTVEATEYSRSPGTYTLESNVTLTSVSENVPIQNKEGTFINISSPVSLRRASYSANSHYYTFNGTAGKQFSIEMNAIGFDGYLYLLDSSGNVVASDDNSGEGYNPRIIKVLPLTGTYTLEATEYWRSPGNFVLQSNIALNQTSQNEPINSSTGAFTTSSPISTRRTSCYANYITFYGTAGKQLRIEMNAIGFDGYMYLIDANGNVVDYDDDSGEGTNPRIEKVLPLTGTYTIELTQRTKTIGNYTVESNIPQPITINSLTANKTSPQVAGTTVRWTANISGGQNPAYLFRVYKGSNIVVSGSWSSANYYDWRPMVAGSDYRVKVYVKENGADSSTAQVKQSGYYNITPIMTPITINSLIPNKTSPRPAGTTIRWVAGISGGQSPVYLFRVYKGNTMVIPGTWSSRNYYDWTPNIVGSDYWIKLYVKENGAASSTAKIKQSGYYNVTPAITINSLSANKTSPQPTGTTIRWTASISGGQNPIYLFRVYKGSTIVVSGNWSSANYYDWRPTSAGSDYWVKLYVKENGTDSSSAKVKQSGYYNITAPINPITINSLTANKTSPQAVGTTIRWSANISGGQDPVYLFRVYKGSTIVDPGLWLSADYYDWRPTSAGSDYWVKVYVKENGAASSTAIIKQSGYYGIN